MSENSRRILLCLALVCMTGAAPVLAQAESAPASEIPGQFEPRAGETFQKWLQRMMEPFPVPKADIVPVEDGYVLPHKAVPWRMIVVRIVAWLRLADWPDVHADKLVTVIAKFVDQLDYSVLKVLRCRTHINEFPQVGELTHEAIATGLRARPDGHLHEFVFEVLIGDVFMKPVLTAREQEH